MTSIEFCSQLISLEYSLLKFAYSFNLKQPDARDLLQETFLKALLNREKYNNQNFKAWTFTIMKNTFVDNYRKSSRNNTSSYQADELFFVEGNMTAVYENPESAYNVREINRNIDQLNEKFRTPLKMHIEGYKYTDIAEELDLKIGTVKNRIFLSRKELKVKLNG